MGKTARQPCVYLAEVPSPVTTLTYVVLDVCRSRQGPFRLHLLALLEFLGRFLRCHGVSPCGRIAPMGDDTLIGKSGAKCLVERERNSSRVECGGCNGRIPSRLPAHPEIMLNKSTNR